ncbi:Uncharacterised protein [Serratia quinivorans]|uniref:hypothetical protein n=1 Tax=Serratia quinivorans TaxID=137545 RepID=UPI002176F258|nr:hypothetical protein [Serratia quinivorans]CAI0844780.1 Uncharacterised protein [Serratia quinivorans]CAI0892357.1 Uncharacterised protein [Serratia quinivorans]CAI1682711.1 Uncharacterised protein [Serratia quinivorans]CAI2081009.1 Uncharacterised protein [Serratia quinivorans]CAI2438171.1 Uncharacterised protein [Serratia quinivorans]
MTMIKAKAKSAKLRRARELQELIQRSSDCIEKTTLVLTLCKTMPDMPAPSKPRKRRTVESELLAPGQISAAGRQKMRGCSRLPRGVI